ncbi:DUF1648 domain-containing protein [Ferroacidibacillus organovorans]|uniref:DUF1648 domain-containing protein n=1 Tax=Ferroacidibacillus organovorans TaxID=1765683 RepID=A0A101XNR4_9BACL|nr:DUF5808 domain-containing protein [Ferroacidibacillus organovorans]KUO94793.1 hypothetical protein ATW55_10285 [Ferroacidibacillus organovorans]
MNPILMITGVITLLILVLQWIMPKVVEPTVPFGVRIPPDRLQDPAVRKAQKTYARGLFFALLICVAAWSSLWRFGLRGTTLEVLASMLPLLPLLLDFAMYYTIHRRLQKTKRDERWMDGYRQVITVDTHAATRRKAVSWMWSLPTVALLLAGFAAGILRYPQIPHVFPVHFNAQGVANGFATKSFMSVFTLSFLGLGLFILMIVLQRATLRISGNLDPADPVGSAQHIALRMRRLFHATWLLIAFVNASLFLGELSLWGVISTAPNAMMLTTMLPIIAGMVVLVFTLGSFMRKAPAEFSNGSESARVVRRDDDVLWVLGVFYFNREDPRWLVEKRFGVGFTTNFAHPLSWVLLGGIVVIVVGSIFLVPHVKKG